MARHFLTHTPCASSPASRFFEPAVIDETRALDMGLQLAGQGQDAAFSPSLSLSSSLVTEINREMFAALADAGHPQHQAPGSPPKSPSRY